MSGPVAEISNGMLDWYWRHGVQRAGEHDLSGAWLDQLYQGRDTALAIAEARRAGRPCLALWGPSQSGKSTLLSRYLDTPAKSDAVSALQWSAEEPVAFVGRGDSPNCVHLNPYNQQRDASGCVTRFVLRREVPDPRHPVELRLASEEQVLQALAAGYVMECDTRKADARETFLDASLLDKKLAELGSRCRARATAQRGVRERLQTLLNVLDDLIATDWPRYRNLRPDWKGLRPRVASDPLLRGDAAALSEFCAWLCWDSQPALTGLWQKLLGQREKILALAAGQPVRCSYAAARLFLDIDAFRKLGADTRAPASAEVDPGLGIPGTPPRSPALPEDAALTPVSSLVSSLGYLADERSLCLGVGLPNPLLANPSEFGLWQGLVWEMTLAVNAELLPEDSPAKELLQTADLLDFPGVALSYPGGVRLKPEQMSPAQLLTEVLKRGKTASIVVTRSRQLGIDGFSLLTRIQAPPAQPTQLLTGVQAWVRALGQTWPPPPDTLPINLVLTFASRLVNGVVDSVQLQRPSTDFSPVFEFLNKLGDLANPRWVRFFTTTYPRFDEGCIRGEAEQVEAAAQLIAASDDFRRHLGPCLDSLRAMIRSGTADGDGGNDYFLAALTHQARQSRLPALLERREQDVRRQLAALAAEALPPAAVGEARRATELEAWSRAIEQAIADARAEHPETDAAARVSQRLRALLDVEPESLEPVPLASQSPDWRGYVERQFLRWRELGKGRDGDWGDLGLVDAAAASRHLGYLAEHALLRGNLHRWLRENLGHLASHIEAAQARRFLAVRISELVSSGVNGRPPHREFDATSRATGHSGPASALTGSTSADSIQPRLRRYAEREQLDPRDREDHLSPHYLGFLAPFLRHLETVKAAPVGARKPQPGDAELAQWATRFIAGATS